MSSWSRVRSLEPALCDQVLEAREKQKKDDLKRTKILLESAGKVGRVLPLKQFCSQAGIPLSVVVTHLPEQKSRYEARYQTWRAKQRAIREGKFRLAVERETLPVTRPCTVPTI